MRITTISDTHTKHGELNLPGGDLLLCSGDISSMGYKQEIENFCKWFEQQDYDKKIFIAGNHDWGFQDYPHLMPDLLMKYDIEYLQDDLFIYNGEYEEYEKGVKIYGSPWQPEFCGWAFNLPRNGEELEQKWDEILPDTDILLTHGPAWGYLDTIKGQTEHLGCELLAKRIEVIKPKIHLFGHIHTGYGYKFENGTHFINASVLNERYKYTQLPLTFDWDRENNTVKGFIA